MKYCGNHNTTTETHATENVLLINLLDAAWHKPLVVNTQASKHSKAQEKRYSHIISNKNQAARTVSPTSVFGTH